MCVLLQLCDRLTTIGGIRILRRCSLWHSLAKKLSSLSHALSRCGCLAGGNVLRRFMLCVGVGALGGFSLDDEQKRINRVFWNCRFLLL